MTRTPRAAIDETPDAKLDTTRWGKEKTSASVTHSQTCAFLYDWYPTTRMCGAQIVIPHSLRNDRNRRRQWATLARLEGQRMREGKIPKRPPHNASQRAVHHGPRGQGVREGGCRADHSVQGPRDARTIWCRHWMPLPEGAKRGTTEDDVKKKKLLLNYLSWQIVGEPRWVPGGLSQGRVPQQCRDCQGPRPPTEGAARSTRKAVCQRRSLDNLPGSHPAAQARPSVIPCKKGPAHPSVFL